MRNIIFGALGAVFVYNILFFQTDYGIGTGLFFLLINLFNFLFKKDNLKNLNLAIASSVISIIFGLLVGFRSNEIIVFVNLLAATFFSLVALYFYRSASSFSFHIPSFILIPLFVAKNYLSSVLSLFNIERSKEPEKNSIYYSLIRGFAITIPVFLVLLIFLTKADPVFSKLVENLFKDIWERIIISVIVFVGFLVSGIIKINEKTDQEDETENIREYKSYELLVLLSSLTLLFGSFILVQFNYFFSSSGERELHALGITSLTYSEYVRKGFFELLIVSTIAVVVILYILKFLHKLPKHQKKWIQVFSSALVLEIGLLLISAGQRINLYQTVHGLTRARVFGFIFLFWLAIILLIILVRIFSKLRKEVLFDFFAIPTLGFLLFINIVNIDDLIATKYKPSVNNEIDYYYLVNLSSDGVASWKGAVQNTKETLLELERSESFSSEEYRQLYWARSTLIRLDNIIRFLNDKYGDDSKIKMDSKYTRRRIVRFRKWQSFNFAEYDAHQKIKQNSELFNQVSALLQKADNFENSRVKDVIRQTVPLDRSIQPPLL